VPWCILVLPAIYVCDEASRSGRSNHSLFHGRDLVVRETAAPRSEDRVRQSRTLHFIWNWLKMRCARSFVSRVITSKNRNQARVVGESNMRTCFR